MELAKIKFLKSRKKPTLSDVLDFASLDAGLLTVNKLQKSILRLNDYWVRDTKIVSKKGGGRNFCP